MSDRIPMTREGYDKLAKEFNFEVIDARERVDEIHAKIREKVKEMLKKTKK